MSLIKELENNDFRCLNEICELHTLAFPHFFLTRLGVPFLKALYRGYIEDPNSGIIIALEGKKIVGFAAYSEDYPLFFKKMIKKHVVRFALCSAKVAFLHPSYIKRILGAFKKSDSVTKTEKYVELASICVDPEKKNHGIGTALISRLKSTVDFSKFSYINLETDADNNKAANDFYLNNGFVLSRCYSTPEGRKMNEYVYKPGASL